jgi:hypothetical protein
LVLKGKVSERSAENFVRWNGLKRIELDRDAFDSDAAQTILVGAFEELAGSDGARHYRRRQAA